MKKFEPDYQNIVDAAYNKTPKRIPLYDHLTNDESMINIYGKPIMELVNSGNPTDRVEGFRRFCDYYEQMGFDVAIYELCLCDALVGGGSLGNHQPSTILNMDDFNKYPWDNIADRYFEMARPKFDALREAMPSNMKALGGIGNGVFECVQDITGYVDLCYISYDDPELYGLMFKRMGQVMLDIWQRFLNEYGDMFCVCRFGDDLGYKMGTLLPPDDVRKHIIPVYKIIIDEVHRHNKPFLLHSCGNLFDVMDDIIDIAKIDAKHSNEDIIAGFSEWGRLYGDRIGNFGGIDCDILTRNTIDEIKAETKRIYEEMQGYNGVALGTGNSVPEYIPSENYMAMNETIRKMRGE